MYIKKEDGSKQKFEPNKILRRLEIQRDSNSGVLNVDIISIFQKVVSSINDGITTREIDEMLAFAAAEEIIKHPDYSILGGRLLLSRQSKIIGEPLEDVDFSFDFFGAATFLKKYSKKGDKGEPLELPHQMYDRVGHHLKLDSLTIDALKNKRFNFASPIYTNSGVKSRGGMISCNLTHLEDDSIEGIENTLTKIAVASFQGAGIGLLLDPLRSKESLVSSFKGNASGVVRLADMVQSKMRFYKQGDRSGSCALYLSVWHKDIIGFLELTLPIGDEKMRTRDLFTAAIINDNFMKALREGKDWYLFCPDDLKKAGLKQFYNLYGEEYEQEYNKAVKLGLGKAIDPTQIWKYIIKSQVESGKPYVFYKDNANKKNMQDNIGVIKQSQLCIEITQVSKPRYTPQCALASINLAENNSLAEIAESTILAVRALNKVIDKNKWSDEWAEKAGVDQRALAIGVAGMADFFAKKGIAFESEEAKEYNEEIFKTMYKAAVGESNRLAVESGENYPGWVGSKYQKGETYIDDWSPIGNKEPIMMKNSLLIGLMPTASSAILLGVFESFEPPTYNLFTRTVGQGEFVVINKYLVRDLEEIGMWNADMQQLLVKNEGSIQSIDGIPEHLKEVYKTVWEIPQKALLDLAIIRSRYVDQSQSMNVYHKNPKYSIISSALNYAWVNGLKTGVYYTRSESAIGNNKKLSDISSNDVNVDKVKKPKDSLFSCAGGGCDA